jgi:hypothetical protein
VAGYSCGMMFMLHHCMTFLWHNEGGKLLINSVMILIQEKSYKCCHCVTENSWKDLTAMKCTIKNNAWKKHQCYRSCSNCSCCGEWSIILACQSFYGKDPDIKKTFSWDVVITTFFCNDNRPPSGERNSITRATPRIPDNSDSYK